MDGKGRGGGWGKVDEEWKGQNTANLNITQTATSGCEQRVVANNEWLLIATSGCEQRVVANNESLLIATSGCEQRVVAKCNEWLLIATSGCEQRVVAGTFGAGVF